MAYYTKVLQPDERVTYVGSLSWIIYRQAIALAVLAIVAAAASLMLSDATQRTILLLVAGVVIALAAVVFVARWLNRIGVEIVVTDKRVIYKTGWIRRHTEEMNVSKIETVDVYQGIMGRLFDYGNVSIKGVGGSIERDWAIASPLALRNAILVG